MVEDDSLFSADGLRSYMGKRAAAEALDDAKREEAQAAAKKAMIADLMKPVEVDQARRDRFARRLKEAADSGRSEMMVLRFPSDLCSDQGRAINNRLAGWENSLVGRPKQLYDIWEKELKPKGFKLRFEVLEYPKGIPGDIGMFVAW
jgi:hypothetical protein